MVRLLAQDFEKMGHLSHWRHLGHHSVKSQLAEGFGEMGHLSQWKQEEAGQ